MSENYFTNKVVVVTGSGQGIGKNIAAAFAREGARVVVCGKDRVKGVTTTAELRQKGYLVEQIVCDLSQPGSPRKLIERVIAKYRRIDVLVNNAKANPRRALFEETEKTWDEGFVVTLKAAFFCSQEAIAQMKKTGGGAIVNISSVAGNVIGDDSVTYHIAKAGMNQMTKYLAVHAAPYGVRVNGVAPGFIIKDEYAERFARADNRQYRRTANFIHPLGRTGTADEVAQVVVFLASGAAAFITGQTLTVDGGLTLQNQNELVFRFSKKV